MIQLHSIRKSHHKAGKTFVLMFNRVSMYGPAHPYSVQATEEFYRSICDLLKAVSPVVLLYSRGQFFLEDEPLDPSLNYFKMSSHFKNTRVTSIAWLQDVPKREVEDFIRVFLDSRTYPAADQMKAAIGSLQITHIRVNHVSYQKVTEDDQIVSKAAVANTETLSGELNASRQYQQALGMIAGKLLMEEVDQGLSLRQLLIDPAAFSRQLVVRAAADHAVEAGADRKRPGFITAHLAALGREIGNGLPGRSTLSLAELAAALVKMKCELQATIHTQGSLGALLDSTEEIQQQTDDLSDTVILELIKKEYDHGKTSIDRLAFVLRRIVTSGQELRRLLPKMRDGLAAEGMPLSDFWELIKRLSQENQDVQLAEWLNRGAEAIGLDGADLASRWKADPHGLARLLYLATEIQRQAGSVQPLCDILVDTIERLGPKMLDAGPDMEGGGDERLRALALFFNRRLVEGLRGEGIDPLLAHQVEARLQDRLEASVAAIRAELSACRSSLETLDPIQPTLLQRLEEGLAEDQELKKILKAVRADTERRRLDENDFQQIFERIQHVQQNAISGNRAIHEIAFNPEITFALLKKEISRAARYGTDLSGIAFSILPVGASCAGSDRSTVTPEVTTAFLAEIQQQLRTADWIGTMNHHLFIAVLPMTTVKEAHLTARRLLKHINSKPVGGSGRAFSAKIAGSVIHYDPKTIANADMLIRCASSEHAEMIRRLRNLQEFM